MEKEKEIVFEHQSSPNIRFRRATAEEIALLSVPKVFYF
jgi:hypothetical protein